VVCVFVYNAYELPKAGGWLPKPRANRARQRLRGVKEAANWIWKNRKVDIILCLINVLIFVWNMNQIFQVYEKKHAYDFLVEELVDMLTKTKAELEVYYSALCIRAPPADLLPKLCA